MSAVMALEGVRPKAGVCSLSSVSVHRTPELQRACRSPAPSSSYSHAQRAAHCKLTPAVASAIATAPAKDVTVSLEKNKLGDSDLLVTEICLGTMTWGEQNTEKEAHHQLSYAFDMGVNFMDTAEMYPVPPKQETQGLTDKYIGSWLKNQKRDEIILASKVAGYSTARAYMRKSGKTLRVDRENVMESVENSLGRLGTDYIDLLQIHWPDRYVPLFGQRAYNYEKANEYKPVPFDEQLRAFEDLVKQGKVRYIGVSNETSYGVMEFLKAAEVAGLPKIVSIQNSYSLLVRSSFETDLAEVCAPFHGNVGLLAYSPLAGGSLSGKYNIPNGHTEASTPFMHNLHRRAADPLPRLHGEISGFASKGQDVEAVGEYMKVAEKYGLTSAQLALAWCRAQPWVASTIIGATTMEQLKENIGAFSIDLPEEAFKDIAEVYKVYRDPTLLD
eukprot:jgi/Chlat1/5779/Chrsp387S09015